MTSGLSRSLASSSSRGSEGSRDGVATFDMLRPTAPDQNIGTAGWEQLSLREESCSGQCESIAIGTAVVAMGADLERENLRTIGRLVGRATTSWPPAQAKTSYSLQAGLVLLQDRSICLDRVVGDALGANSLVGSKLPD